MRTEQYSFEEFERFAKGMKKTSDILKSKNPDFVFAPVTGSVPFIDLLFIVDRHFNLGRVEYPPNSSRFEDREGIMSRWYQNFLNTNYNGAKMSITCVDEVISGASAVKGYQEFEKALYDFKKRTGESLEKKVDYNMIGIAEQPKSGARNHILAKLVNSKKIKIVEVGNIITADNVELNPVRLKIDRDNLQGRHIYFPEIEKFYISDYYITLLQNFAGYFGADPSKVTAQNLGKIKDSIEKYLK